MPQITINFGEEAKALRAGQRFLAQHGRTFFRDLTDKCIRRGVFHSVQELITTITVSVQQHNNKPKPFIRTAKASHILEKVKRGRAALNKRPSA